MCVTYPPKCPFCHIILRNMPIDVGNIYHPSIVNEGKANMDKEAYKNDHNMGVYIPSVKRKLD